MGSAAQILQPPKARLQALLSGVEELEARVLQAKPIKTIRVARCGHPECGAAPPAELPVDALVIEMGCAYAVPQIQMPEPEKVKQRAEPSRVNDSIGVGISEQRQKRVLSRIQLL
jgi:hypothetical protein